MRYQNILIYLHENGLIRHEPFLAGSVLSSLIAKYNMGDVQALVYDRPIIDGGKRGEGGVINRIANTQRLIFCLRSMIPFLKLEREPNTLLIIDCLCIENWALKIIKQKLNIDQEEIIFKFESSMIFFIMLSLKNG